MDEEKKVKVKEKPVEEGKEDEIVMEAVGEGTRWWRRQRRT